MKKAQLFNLKTRISRAKVSQLLAQLSEKVADGQVILRREQGDVVLDLPQELDMKVKTTCKDKPSKNPRHKLTLQLTWRQDDPHQPLELG